MKDALTLGKELKEKEEQRIKFRIARALKGDTGITSGEQTNIARWLYEARWDGHRYDDVVEEKEILENFCWKVFGASFEEAMKAYDKFLG
jgi:hypothetical protein